MPAESVLNGKLSQGATADNATAAVIVTAVPNQRHFVTMLDARYSAVVALIKTVTLFFGGAAKLTIRWDFAKGPFNWALPSVLHADYGQLVQLTLDASGTAGITGRCSVETFLR